MFISQMRVRFSRTNIAAFPCVSSRRIDVLVAKKNPHWIFAVVRFVQCKKINKKIET
jgi:hypothetical protein